MDLKNLFFRTVGDAVGRSYGLVDNEHYIHEGVRWLMRAQDIAGDGGGSAQYSLFHGWDGSYIETTGYILETFFTAAQKYRNAEYKKRAVRMADFLVRVQLSSGAFQSGTPQDLPAVPRVFNTGEGIRGLITAYEKTGGKQYLKAARKAADWLISIQEKDGSWIQHEFQNRKHAYHSRTAWALLRVWQATKEKTYRQAAEKNLRWVVSKQQKNGWFSECDFTTPKWPFTHAIDYTMSGFLASSRILKNATHWKAGKTCADALLRYYAAHHAFMPATFTAQWKSSDTYTCLTGDAQIAYTWLMVFQETHDQKYLKYAVKLLDDIKKTVDVSTEDLNIRGAVAGAFPHYGGYSRWNYPNWATKFFVDACMILEECQKVQ